MANRHPSQRGTRRVLFAIQSARRPMFSGAARTASGPVGPWHGSVPVSPFRAFPIGTARLKTRANTRTSRRNPFILHTLLPPAQAVGGQFTPARISADSLNSPPSCLHHGPQRDKERKSTVAALRFPPGRSALTGLLFECSTSNRYLAMREASLSIGRAATPHCMSGHLYSLCFAARCRVQKDTG